MKTMLKSMVESLLRWAAKRVISQKKPFIIGITGTAGKTTTKSAISYVLTNTLDRQVRVAEGNLNTEIGLPLVILNLNSPQSAGGWPFLLLMAFAKGVFSFSANESEVLVLEYGIDRPGDMDKLLSIARPNIGILTNVGSAHTNLLKTVDGVAKEKSKLILSLPKTGIAVLNKRDKRVAELKKRTRAKVIMIDRPASEFAQAVAVAVAENGFGISIKEALKHSESWERPFGRLRLFSGLKGTTIIDDTYNANPVSMSLALEQLQKISKQIKAKRKIAVLADMLELGQEEYAVHKQIAAEAAKDADVVVLVGTRFRRVATEESRWFAGPQPAAAFLLSFIEKGDIVLIKGSQSMRMEKVVEVLLKNKKDTSNLVRQSSYWKKKPYLTP